MFEPPRIVSGFVARWRADAALGMDANGWGEVLAALGAADKGG
jgi:hypothetical protein